jgi:integrase
MPKKVAELGALAVSRLSTPGLNAVGGVSGLHLQIIPPNAKSWVLRTMVGGKRRDIGLGGFPDVTLAQAREKARATKEKIAQGIDPIEEQRAARSLLAASHAKAQDFEQCTRAYVKSMESGWSNAKHAKQWLTTLETYAFPVMGRMLVRDVGVSHVLQVLEPIWATKTETATRVRQRMEAVLDWAKSREYRSGDNPARWKGHLDKQLPKPSKVAKVVHHPALDLNDVQGFISAVRTSHGVGARALEFVMLTACRSGEVRGAQWSEFDLEAAVWTVPEVRMKIKGKGPHRVPLSDAAVRLIKDMPKIEGTDFVFSSAKGGALSDMTLTSVIRRLNEGKTPPPWRDRDTGEQVVPHGLRSTFRDWASERTAYARDVVEMALAHAIENKVEAAYRRGDLFDKRTRLMADWAEFCDKAPALADNVTGLRKKRA